MSQCHNAIKVRTCESKKHCGNSSQHTRVCRKIEDKSSQEGEEHTGDNNVNDKVEGQTQHEEVVGDVQVGGVWAAGIVHPVFPAAEILHHPLSTLHKVTQIRTITILKRRRNEEGGKLKP